MRLSSRTSITRRAGIRVAFFFGLMALACAGCVPLVPYQPDEGALDKMGPDATRKFQELLGRAVDPTVSNAEVTDDFVRLSTQQTMRGMYGIPYATVPSQAQVFYTNIGKMEIYQNHFVYLYDPANNLFLRIMFGTDEDAKGFTDFLASYRARKKKGAGAAPPPAPAPAEAPKH